MQLLKESPRLIKRSLFGIPWVLDFSGGACYLATHQDRFQSNEGFIEAGFLNLAAEKYCRLLKEENGFQLLEDLIGRTNHPEVKRFAKIALEGSIIFLERNDGLSDASDYLEG